MAQSKISTTGRGIGALGSLRSSFAETALTIAALSVTIPATAQTEDGGGTVEALDTIIVTAERIGRSLMETSTSVVVLDTEELERGITSGTNDVMSRIANITTTGTGNFAPTVRGVDGTGPAQGADAFIAGTRSRLNIQLDGRPATYNEIVFGDAGVWDVEQIEVLRGPQSTLQGRNAIAGTLAVRTKSPTYEPEARFRVIGGNMQTRQYSGTVSAPLIDDQVALRISADHASHESFVRFAPFPGVDDPREFTNETYRAKLLIEPTAIDGLTALVTLNHAKAMSMQVEWVQEPYDSHVSGVTGGESAFEPRTTSGILDVRLDINDHLDWQTLLATTDLSVKRFAQPGAGNADIDGRERVAESSLHFDLLDGRLSGIAGLYYFDSETDEVLDLAGGGSFTEDSRTTAVFSEATLALSDQFDLTLGARYEEEHRRREGSVFLFLVDVDETYETFLPKLVLSWHPNDELTVGTLVARGYNGGSAGITFFPPFATYTFDPEYVWNYEAFARTRLADGRIELSGNVFFSDYEDMQLPFSIGRNVVIRNADKVETYGAEIAARWQALPALEFSAGLGLLQTKIKEFTGADVEGDELPRSPEVTGNLGAKFEHHSGLELGVDARYSAAYFSDQTRNPSLRTNRTEPYWLVDAILGYQLGRVRLFGFATNLFDSNKPLLLVKTAGSGFTDYTGAQILQPRVYGVGVQVEFN